MNPGPAADADGSAVTGSATAPDGISGRPN